MRNRTEQGRSWRQATVALVAISGLILAACGGDDSDADDGDGGDAPSESEVDASADASSESTVPTDGSDDGATTESTDAPDAGEPAGDDELAALIEAAQAEGNVTFYAVPAEASLQRVADGFSEEYGIDVDFIRATTEMKARYAAEAESGNTVADIYINGTDTFVDEMMAAGYWTPLEEADIPGYPEDYPEEWQRPEQGTATISVGPIGIGYNTELVSEDELPTDWDDLADPRWDDKIIISSPFQSTTSPVIWRYVLEDYGEEVLRGIGDNIKQVFPSTVPATETLAAGEAELLIPAYGAVVSAVAEQGGPVDMFFPEMSTGRGGFIIGLSSDAPHPAAARLLAHYLMFGDGQSLINEDPGVFSPVLGENPVSGMPIPGDLRDNVPYEREWAMEVGEMLGVDPEQAPEG